MAVPPGWYPNPDGTPTQRWWTGLNWSIHVSVLPPQRVSKPVLKAPEGTSSWTLQVWLIAATPLVSILLLLLDELFDASGVWLTVTSAVITLALAAATIALAVFDRRELLGRGVPSPFPWAWAFLTLLGAPVYVIGRAVIARRRTGSGLAPMWAYVGLWLVQLVIGATIVGARLMDAIGWLGGAISA